MEISTGLKHEIGQLVSKYEAITKDKRKNYNEVNTANMKDRKDKGTREAFHKRDQRYMEIW